MKKIIVVFSILAIIAIIYYHYSVKKNESASPTQSTASVTSNGLNIKKIEDGYPHSNIAGNRLIKHFAYHLSFSNENKQPEWVCYILTRSMLTGTLKSKRKNNFRIDPDVPEGSATPADYKKTGFDKGHIAPAADMSWNETAMSESFFMSNMSPQRPEFNRGIWKDLEEKVRSWAVDNDSIYVISGPVFKDNTGKIGNSNVTVPGHFFKVILDFSRPTYKAAAYYFPNQKAVEPLAKYALTVDELEKITGLDFFADQNKTIIEAVESKLNLADWK